MDNEKLYEDMKPKEKFEVLWAESGLADRPGAENLWQQMVALGFFEKPASITASASNTDLANGDNWNIINDGTKAIPHKAIAIAKIVSRG